MILPQTEYPYGRAARVPAIGHRSRLLLALWLLFGNSAQALELKADTEAAFERYIHLTETQMEVDVGRGRFLVIDGWPDRLRDAAYEQLQRGRVYIQQVDAKDGERPIPIPDGLIHHWTGVMFLSGVRLSQVVALLQDYDHHKEIYEPDVQQSKLLDHNGSEFRVYERLYRKSIVTVVINANFDVHYRMLDATRAMSCSHSTRIAEVDHPNQPNEHELPVGNDHGYAWRLYSYWRLEQKDGGVYVQLESIALSRRVPVIWAWLVNPLLQSIPRTAISDALNATRRALISQNPSGATP
jgi:hypothetical protein